MNIKVIVKNPGCEPIVISRENNLESIQKLVSGYIEIFKVLTLGSRRVVGVCNEEGLLLPSMLPNIRVDGRVIMGPVVFEGETKDGEPRSLSNKEAAEILALLSVWKL
jgi:hypothetical protein